jgi:hypothetical protein
LRIKVEFAEAEADELNVSAPDRAALDVSFVAQRETLLRFLTETGEKSHSQAQQLWPGFELRKQAIAFKKNIFC